MIANISSSALSYEETLNTLNYSNRAKNIRVMLKKNILDKEDIEFDKISGGKNNQDGIVNSLKNEIFELRKLLNERNDIKKKSNSQHRSREIPKIINDNNTKEIFDSITKMQRLIGDHFQVEIKITKDILEKEKEIALKKVLLKETQINFLKFPSKNDLNEKINSLSKEIGNLYKFIEEKHSLQENCIKKRSELQKMISQQNSEHAKIILRDNVNYNLLLIQNLNLEAKKYADSAELKIKDLQLDALTNQIKAKDLMLENSQNYEVKKKLKNDNLKNLENKLGNANQVQRSVSQSQPIKKNTGNYESALNDSNNANVKDKKNFIQNFRSIIGINENSSVLKKENKKGFNNILEIDNKSGINNKGVNRLTGPKKVESTRNKIPKELTSIINENDLAIKSKSPKNINNSNRKINDFILNINKKDLTDRNEKVSNLNGNNLKPNSIENKKNEKPNIYKIEQYMDTESAEEYKRYK